MILSNWLKSFLLIFLLRSITKSGFSYFEESDDRTLFDPSNENKYCALIFSLYLVLNQSGIFILF